MKWTSILVFLLLAASLFSCVSPKSPMVIPSTSPTMIKPGDTLGEAKLKIARDETGEPDIFNYCNPLINESERPVIVRTCTVPQMPYLSIGYGELASTQEELETLWKAKTWQFYFDERAVDLESFGFFDIGWEGNRIRRWKIAVENLPPGEHSLHYILNGGPQELEDITWVFTFGQSALAVTPTPQKTLYPTLSAEILTGQHSYTSEKAGLDFWLYLPATYGKDEEEIWPLILFLHGRDGNSLETQLFAGLPKRFQWSDLPFIVLSPLGGGEYEFWSKDEMINSLFVLLDEIQAMYSVDPQRIYLTGVSVGGEGVWEIGLRYPERFAALIPVMGYYDYPFTVPTHICNLKNVPIWAFHGAQDDLVPLDAEKGLVDALKRCGGNALLTVFPDAGHDIGNEVLSNPQLYMWMLDQKRQ